MKREINLIHIEREERFILMGDLLSGGATEGKKEKLIQFGTSLFEEQLISAQILLELREIDLRNLKAMFLRRKIYYISLNLEKNENRIKEWNEYQVINCYDGSEIDEDFLSSYYDLDYYKERDRYNEILAPGYLDKIVFSYEDIYILPFHECVNYKNPRVLHIHHKSGIKIKDIAKAFYSYMPDYGDHRYFEGLEYFGDYKGIALYELNLGS
ncbi:MAG: hypothetical protein GF353_19175 [Candidatus Lokiarchaeota archaeon]|nr:hypothetical protein [Candidatus Lokiarchaeota archaeon]